MTDSDSITPSLSDEQLKICLLKLIDDITSSRSKNGMWSPTNAEYIQKSSLLTSIRNTNKALLDIIWDILNQCDSESNLSILFILSEMINVCDEVIINQWILPALIFLSNSKYTDVRFASLKPIGNLILNSKDSNIPCLVGVQFERIVDQNQDNHSLLIELLSIWKMIMPHAPAKLREDIILPMLNRLADKIGYEHSQNKFEMAKSIFDVICAFQGCRISTTSLNSTFIGTLRSLAKNAECLDVPTRNKMRIMLNDLEKYVN